MKVIPNVISPKLSAALELQSVTLKIIGGLLLSAVEVLWLNVQLECLNKKLMVWP